MTLNQKVDVIEFILRQNYHHSLDQKARIVLQLAASIPAKETNALTNLLELAKAYGARDLYCRDGPRHRTGEYRQTTQFLPANNCSRHSQKQVAPKTAPK